jgi:hypothetical protein
MRFKWSTMAILVIALPLLVIANNQPNRIKKSELKNHSFDIGRLKLTITRFRASRGFTAYGPSSIEVKVENSSDGAAIFNPQYLSLVGKDDKQVNIQGQKRPHPVSIQSASERLAAPQPKSVAAGAWIKEGYEFYDWVRLPARLFYDGKELALITD